MYTTLTMFTTKPGMREIVEKLADGMFSTVSGMKGFKSVTFFADPETDEYGGFSLWESKEDADAAFTVTGPKLEEALNDIGTGPPTRRVFEVYEPKV